MGPTTTRFGEKRSPNVGKESCSGIEIEIAMQACRFQILAIWGKFTPHASLSSLPLSPSIYSNPFPNFGISINIRTYPIYTQAFIDTEREEKREREKRGVRGG